jgi:aminopeptidase N
MRSGIIFLLALSMVWAVPIQKSDDDDSLKLPKTSVPLSYDLSLKTSLRSVEREFSGTVKIQIEVIEATDTITLHNRGLAIESVTMIDSDGIALDASYRLEPEKDFMHIVVESRQLLVAEALTVEIAFTGSLRLDMSGFYRSSYKSNGAIR